MQVTRLVGFNNKPQSRQHTAFRAGYDRYMIDRVSHSLKVRQVPESTIAEVQQIYGELAGLMANADRGLGNDVAAFNKRLDSGLGSYTGGRKITISNKIMSVVEMVKGKLHRAELGRDKELLLAQVVGPDSRIATYDAKNIPPYYVKLPDNTSLTFAHDGLYVLKKGNLV